MSALPRSHRSTTRSSGSAPGSETSVSSGDIRLRSPTAQLPSNNERWMPGLLELAEYPANHPQSVATSSARQIPRIRAPLSEPIRSTSIASETDSTESRFTALRQLIASSSGSRTTSLGSPRESSDRCRARCDQRAAQSRDRGIARQHDERSTTDLRRLTPPQLTALGHLTHVAAAALRNDARSPHSS